MRVEESIAVTSSKSPAVSSRLARLAKPELSPDRVVAAAGSATMGEGFGRARRVDGDPAERDET
jgi:hypothetical protein